jgi:hypothetical protein
MQTQSAPVARKAWIPPQLTRLASGSAEIGPNAGSDGCGTAS